MTRKEGAEKIARTRDWIVSIGHPEKATDLTEFLNAFDSMPSTAGAILGSKGGNTPVKPGSRPRGRPRKDAISEKSDV
jgi:hypothetical protein